MGTTALPLGNWAFMTLALSCVGTAGTEVSWTEFSYDSPLPERRQLAVRCRQLERVHTTIDSPPPLATPPLALPSYPQPLRPLWR